MKITTLLLPALLLLPACNGNDTKAADGQTMQDKAKGAMNDAKESVAKTVDDIKQFTNERLAAADKAIGDIKAKAAASKEANKPEMDKAVHDLDEKRKTLAAKMEQLKDATGEKLATLGKEIKELATELKQSASDAWAKFKN